MTMQQAELGNWCPTFRDSVVASSSRVEGPKAHQACYSTGTAFWGVGGGAGGA
jgi:hypothetical protein